MSQPISSAGYAGSVTVLPEAIKTRFVASLNTWLASQDDVWGRRVRTGAGKTEAEAIANMR